MPIGGSHSASIGSPSDRDATSISARLPTKLLDMPSENGRHSGFLGLRRAIITSGPVLASGALHADAFHGGLRLGGARNCHGEHAVLERRLGVIDVETVGQRHHALDASKHALAPDKALVPLFVLVFLLAANYQRPGRDRDVDIVLVHAGQLGLDVNLLVVFAHVDAGQIFSRSTSSARTKARRELPA